MTPKSKAPKLAKLTEGCNNGASNLSGLILALAEASREIPPQEMAFHPAIRNVLGHMNFLCGQGIGPDGRSFSECVKWLEGGE